MPQTDVRRASSLNTPTLGWGIINLPSCFDMGRHGDGGDEDLQ